MDTKICIICKIEKPIDEFKRSYCIPCKKEYEKQHNSKRRKWNEENKDLNKKYQQKYVNKPDIKLKLKKYGKIYGPQYKKEKLKTDPIFKLTQYIRTAVWQSFKCLGSIKPTRTEQILGCTFEQFKQHIESQFEPWMNWENQGGRIITKINESWDLDHIIPISSAKTKEDVIKLSHYTNFQPLCSYNNRFIKRDKK